MAAAAASDQLTEDYCCAYCLQRLPYMVDPRQLPCSHVFCLDCLKYKMYLRQGKCGICSQAHQTVDPKNLPKVVIVVAKNEHIEDKEYETLCDVCAEEKAVAVMKCSDCKKNYCKQHQQMHDIILGPDHTTRSIYSGTSNTCQEHADVPLTAACKLCHATFCALCDTKAGCAQGQHRVMEVEKLAESMRQVMDSELKVLSARISDITRSEKSVWNNLDAVESDVEKLYHQVDLDEANEVQKIKQYTAEAKKLIADYLEKATNESGKQSATLMSKKEDLQNLWRSKVSVTKMSDLILIEKQKENLTALKEATTPALQVVKPKYSQSRLYTENVSRTLLSIACTPTLPTHLKSMRMLAPQSEVVFWSQTGMLISAGGKELQFFNKKFHRTSFKRLDLQIMSLSELSLPGMNTEYFVWVYESSKPIEVNGSSCHEEISVKAWLRRYSSQFKLKSTLEKYEFNRSKASDTIKSQQFVRKVAVNPAKSHIIVTQYRKIDVFSLEEDLLFTIENNYNYFLNLKALLPRPDGTLLLLGGGELLDCTYKAPVATQHDENRSLMRDAKYHTPTAANRKVWSTTSKSANMLDPQGICEDGDGCIYVAGEGAIHILSPAGELLKQLPHQQLRCMKISDAYVTKSGDQIAVACGGDGLKLFSLSIE